MSPFPSDSQSTSAQPVFPLHHDDIFPSLEHELGAYRRYLRGRVLNAGAGDRDIAPLVEGTVVNQDIEGGTHSAGVDVYSPLEELPFEDAHFDAVVCNAVLEHVPDPAAAMRELARVCRPGGFLYLVVPFLQPEHLDPGDFQRYTRDGLARLCELHGFGVIRVEGMHSVYVTLAWVVAEWLQEKPGVTGRILRATLFPYLKRRARTSNESVHSIASAYRALAVRVAEG